jgi:ABC-type Zn uptake system ZnuABC Zn-binding protein ZnuA
MAKIEQASHTENFQVGEFADKEVKAKDILKKNETDAVNELGHKLEDNYSWNEKVISSDAGENVYSVTAGEDAYILNGDLHENICHQSNFSFFGGFECERAEHEYHRYFQRQYGGRGCL